MSDLPGIGQLHADQAPAEDHDPLDRRPPVAGTLQSFMGLVPAITMKRRSLALRTSCPLE